MYKIKNLKYNNILNIENLSIEKNNITFISGASGSGKSSLLKLLHGDNYSYTGEIMLDNKLLAHMDSNIVRNRIGYLSQEHVFFKQTILDELKYINKLLEKEITKNRVESLLNLVCLPLKTDYEIEKMSGGEKQRLALARLLSTDKEVLLLDEPTSSLDNKTGEQVITNLKEYCKNKIKLIIVTHNTNFLSDSTNQIIALDKGEMINGN